MPAISTPLLIFAALLATLAAYVTIALLDSEPPDPFFEYLLIGEASALAGVAFPRRER